MVVTMQLLLALLAVGGWHCGPRPAPQGGALDPAHRRGCRACPDPRGAAHRDGTGSGADGDPAVADPFRRGWLGLAGTAEAEHTTESAAEALVKERGLPEAVAATIRSHFDTRRRQFPAQLTDDLKDATLTSALRLELIDLEREHLHRLLREGKISDEARRRTERELDLDEATVVFKSARRAELPV